MDLRTLAFLKVIHVTVFVGSLIQISEGQSDCSGATDRLIKDVCYTFYNETLTWQRAKASCEEKGKVLASVDSMIQIKEMLLRQGIGTQVYIGASDIAEEGNFVWAHNNKTAVELNKLWETNEPNDYGGNEDCVVLFVNFETNDVPCYFDYPYFCMSSPKEVSEAEKPFISQQNIYIIVAAGAAFILLVLAIACVIVCRRKGKRMQTINRPFVYDSYPKEDHDTANFTSGQYAALKSEPNHHDKDTPHLKEENHYDYIGAETPTEDDHRFYVNVANPSCGVSFHQTKKKELQ